MIKDSAKQINKVYRIRNKTTKLFIIIGSERKTKWNSYPSVAIKNSNISLEDHEVVLFEYKLISTRTISIK